MVERMRYINLMGHVGDLDRVIEKYMARYDIQLEYAAKELTEAEGLTPIMTVNPYAESLRKGEKFQKMAPLPWSGKIKMTAEEAARIIDEAELALEKKDAEMKTLEARKKSLEEYKKTLEPFRGLYFDMSRLSDFHLIDICFGKMPLSNFKQLEAFLYDDPEILFVQGQQNKEYVWGVYATPHTLQEKIDSIFASLHFERIPVDNHFDGETVQGPPEKALAQADAKIEEILDQMNCLISGAVDGGMDSPKLAEACAKAREMHATYEARKFASKTLKDYFVFVGWMAERDAIALQSELAEDDMVIFISDDGRATASGAPPTKLKNPPLIRFFEFFTNMYGLPAYGEIDPTPFLAVTYTLLFGFMFGDLGQGAVIAALGLILYRAKGIALGAVMSVIGVASMIFGVLYGSVFGFEIPALWRRPEADINTTLFTAVGIGVVLIFCAMLLNIINAIRQKNWPKFFFSPNGAAGFIFYAAVIAIVLSVLLNHPILTAALAIVFIIIPLILIAFREPLANLAAGRRTKMENGIALFTLEIIIEIFEVLLTYFTNTVSFVRVGAFALSHAGMMSVVRLMSHTAMDNSYNLIAMILGNILVIAMEGLIVGIQVLRLEFYEMFSRFFEGGGRAFESYRSRK
ncbi:MAG: ATPase [Clostridiales bacterium]|jgi:V/A-type H+-transporting ATPase subunit I|nr:ATPase [Clostridiales bacterium]